MQSAGMQEVSYPGVCPACGEEVAQKPDEAVKGLVLDVGGWVEVWHVPKRCRRGECNLAEKRIFHNYVADGKTDHLWIWPNGKKLPYFFLYARWGVSAAWLRQMSRRLVTHFASFRGEAKTHRAEAKDMGLLHCIPDKAHLKLFRAWLVWRLIRRVGEYEVVPNVKAWLSRRLNIIAPVRELLDQVWSWYPGVMLDRRIAQSRSLGENLSKQIVDGNLKLSSRVCGRPVAELLECREVGMFTATPCSCTPLFKKRRCAKHDSQNVPSDPGPDQAEVITAHRRHRMLREEWCAEPYDVRLTPRDQVGQPNCPSRWCAAEHVTPGQLHEYWATQEANGYTAAKSAPGDLAATTCKTHKESSSGYSKLVRQGRLSGWLIATTSNGIIVHAKPFMGAESVSQRYFFLAEIAAKVPELYVIIHDDACHVRRFAHKHQGRSELGRRLAFPRMHYIIDKLHAKGHVDEWCKQHCNPSVPQNAELIAGVKTSMCETVNSVIGRHKYMLRHMRGLTGAFFMHEVFEIRNALAQV